MTNEPSPLKDAIMDAVYVQLERDDMQTPCTLPFMTSSEHGVCDGDGFPVSDETIASALDAVAKIQTEYNKLKKETQKEMTVEASPRPWRAEQFGGDQPCCLVDADGSPVCVQYGSADAALIVDAVNERAKFEAAHMEFPDFRPVIIAAGQRDAAIAERDRLRDIVRRFLDLFTPGTIHPAGTMERLLRKARAAIGEDEQC